MYLTLSNKINHTLNVNINNDKIHFKHRRSHSAGFINSISQVCCSQMGTNEKIDNFTIPQSETEYSQKNVNSIRRKSLDPKECNPNILVPTSIVHTFEQCCNYEENEKQKVKQTITFEVFTKSISDKLNKLLSENINMKNKLEKLHLRKSKIKKELNYLKEMNELFTSCNKDFSDKYNTLKILYEENTEKIKKIISVTKLLSTIEDCELSILKQNRGIALLQNDQNISERQHLRIKNSIQELNSSLLTQIMYFKKCSSIGIKYLNYLIHDVYNDISNNQNEYILKNKNLKLKYMELKKNGIKKKTSKLLFNIFLYFLFY